MENALNTLNFIRYIAGISADVETSDYYEKYGYGRRCPYDKDRNGA